MRCFYFQIFVTDFATKNSSGILIDPRNNAALSIGIKQPPADSFTFPVKKFFFQKNLLS